MPGYAQTKPAITRDTEPHTPDREPHTPARNTAWSRRISPARAADFAYQAALGCGFRGSFLDLELELWKDLCQAVLHSPLAREFLRRAARSAAGMEGQR